MAKKKKKKVNANQKAVKITTPAEELKDEEIQEEVTEKEEVTLKEDKKAEKLSKKEVKAAKKAEKKDSKNKKHWFKDFKAELKKVIWPNKKELATDSTVVIVVVIVVALIVLVLDLIFEGLTSFEVKQLEKIQNSTQTVNENVVDNSVSNEISNESTDEGVQLNETNATE